MPQNLDIYNITPETPDWTCKVQVVDLCAPGESKGKKIKYLNMILEDEQEQQIKATVYGEDIPSYQDMMKLYYTYYITGARVQIPTLKYEKHFHTYEWILDKKTIVDEIEKDAIDALPLPTKLTLASFSDIKHAVVQTVSDLSRLEFDILAIVANCSPPRYVPTVGKTLQELIVVDTFKQALTFTIWEEAIMESQGTELLQQFSKYPIILVRHVGTSKFNDISLTTKFNTSIKINPPYPQCHQLQTWVTENKELLTSFTFRSTSKSGTLIPIPMDEQIVPIADIPSQQNGQAFSIEAKISFLDNLNSFFVLRCSKCEQEVRSLTIREVHCFTFHEKHLLVPRCRFEVNLTDPSGSTIGIITDKEAERLLSLSPEEIFKRASTPATQLLGNNFLTSAEQRRNTILLAFALYIDKPTTSCSHSTKVFVYSMASYKIEQSLEPTPSQSLVFCT